MRLPSVLADADLSPAELRAARLDGEVYDLAGAFCLIGEIEGPAHRARAVLGGRSPRLIAELGTAAWIWGAADEPARLEFAVTPEARARLSPADHITVREIVYLPGDLADLGGVRVTNPTRTLLDLARGNSPALDVMRRLSDIDGVTLADCLLRLERQPGASAKDRARGVLTAALGF